jgi:hypothetical protein
MMTKPKRPKQSRRDGFVILNKWGDVWVSQVFDCEAEAHKYARMYWENYPGWPSNFDYTVVKGYVVARALIAKESA